jgi:hypothetical protein
MYAFPHRWDAVEPGWFVRAPDGSTWRYDGVWIADADTGQARAILVNESGDRAEPLIARADLVDVLFMPATHEDFALASLRRNFPNIEKISEIMDSLV